MPLLSSLLCIYLIGVTFHEWTLNSCQPAGRVCRRVCGIGDHLHSEHDLLLEFGTPFLRGLVPMMSITCLLPRLLEFGLQLLDLFFLVGDDELIKVFLADYSLRCGRSEHMFVSDADICIHRKSCGFSLIFYRRPQQPFRSRWSSRLFLIGVMRSLHRFVEIRVTSFEGQLRYSVSIWHIVSSWWRPKLG